MGCLVAKCSLTNTALNSGDDVYINMITDTARNQTYGYKHALQIGEIKVPVAKSYSIGGSQSCQYYTPIGIMLKAEYTGWSSFKIDVNDKRTIENLKVLSTRLLYSYLEDDQVVFDAPHVVKLIETGEYQQAWEIIDENLRIAGEEKVYFQNGGLDSSKLYYNVISTHAFEILLDEQFQKNVYSDYIYGVPKEDIKTYQERIESIPTFINAVVAKHDEFMQSLRKKNYDLNDDQADRFFKRNDTLTRSLFEYSHQIDKKDFIISQKNVMDTSIMHSRMYDTQDDVQTKNVLSDLILQHYVNLVYHYLNVDYAPLSNVNLEEYDNNRAIIFNEFQSKVIKLSNDEHYRDCLFEGNVKLRPKTFNDQFFIATYYNERFVEHFYEHIKEKYSVDYQIIGVPDDKDLVVYDKENNIIYFEYEDTIIDKCDILNYAGV